MKEAKCGGLRGVRRKVITKLGLWEGIGEISRVIGGLRAKLSRMSEKWENFGMGGRTGRLVFGRGEGRSGLVGEGVGGVVLAFS